MTNEQINIAIAESLGEIDPRYTTTGGFIASYVINGVTVGFHGLPNYTSDLNACHEFEKTLDDELDLDYSQNLESVTGTRWGANNSYDMSKYRSSTARQRCEAYLRTLNLFVD
jgi:hypothetical protein